ncbi:MAG: UvrD-helicase domain-containing protein [Lentisphaeria bacterium]|nr:UvrD-helicase domain-containing protein [Lentisphaeria bacterium]
MNPQPLSPALTMSLTGKQLLEASAGTGKTFAIKILYARLILEESFSVPEILTVTFTVAAVSELKDRIREELENLLRLLEDPAIQPEPVEAELLSRVRHDPASARRKLRNALRDFDRAAISTIHGFCARTLGDFAYENGKFFQSELEGSAHDNKAEIVRDWIRRRFYHHPGTGALLVQRHGVEKITDLIGKILARPDAEMRPLPAGMADAVEQHLGLLASMWRTSAGAPGEILLNNNVLSKAQSKGLPEFRCQKAMEAWDTWADGVMPGDLAEAIHCFSADYHSEIVKKGKTPPEDPFFAECAKTEQLLDRAFRDLLREGADFVRRELLIRREYTGETSFDDLLTDLNDALQRPGAAQAVRSNFRAALIDEFQDTDPIQYRIFQTLFDGGDFPLFLVGDPKQAIYSFRGADFATYCRAAQETPQKTSLAVNFRSEKAIVQAVNEIFVRENISFGGNGIGCQPVESSGKPEKDGRILTVNGNPDPQPFKIYYPAENLLETLRDAASRKNFKIRMLVSRISALLTDPDLLLEGRRIRPSDLAVLITDNRFGEELRTHLNACGIPAIPRQTPSVLLSPEREMMLDLAQSMLNPGDRTVLRRALAWDCFRIPLMDFFDENAIHPWQKKFQEAAQLWRNSGFITAFQCLAEAGGFAEHLTGVRGGERRWSNLEQLAELLQNSCRRIPADLRVIQRLLDPEENRFREEEAQSRLISDLDAVTIVTIHKSKGLQYPIVLLPLPDFKDSSAAIPCFYHENNNGILDFDPDADALNRTRQEQQEETLRLIYVALTRSVNRCEGILLPEAAVPLHFFPAAVNAQASAICRIPVEAIPDIAPVSIPSGYEIDQQPEIPKIALSWTSHSFSSLIQSVSPLQQEDHPHDYDGQDEENDPENPPPPDRDLIMQLPAGAVMGECIHNIFENIGFDDPPERIRKLCENALKTYHLAGTDSSRLDALCAMVPQVLRAPLLPGLQLCSIPRQDTLRECRFLFPAETTLDPEKLHRILSEFHTPEHPYLPEYLPERPIAAGDLVNGAIDLVFRRDNVYYLADWKSNSMNRNRNDFQSAGIAGEMRRHSYPLQYLLYLTALRRHWRRTLVDFDYRRNFGGVFYLFVRGIRDGAADSGIYRDVIPPEELLAALEEVLGI